MIAPAPSYVSPATASAPATKQAKVFFPNLDGLRFICFLLVFLFHCHKTIFHSLPSGGTADVVHFLFRNGELGVNFFFVLSGFLITYLLLKEKSFTGTIHLGHFYLRRVLRIWPLFFLCVAIGFVVIPPLKAWSGGVYNEVAQPLYYIFFVNNFDYINSWPALPDALILIVLWSVAVEEQFYVVWPLVVRFIHNRYLPWTFVAVIAGSLLFRAWHTGAGERDYAVRQFHTLAVIGDMAVGGLLAYGCLFHNRFLAAVTNMPRASILFIYAGSFAILFFREELFAAPWALVVERLVIAFFFGMVILEQNFAQHSLFKFSRWQTFSRAGIYTYGLYCLHFFVISSVQGVADKLGFTKSPGISIALAAGALALTIGAAWVTYHYFELPFLKKKDRFARIIKG